MTGAAEERCGVIGCPTPAHCHHIPRAHVGGAVITELERAWEQLRELRVALRYHQALHAAAVEHRRRAEEVLSQTQYEVGHLRVELAGTQAENRQLKATIVIVNGGRAA